MAYKPIQAFWPSPGGTRIITVGVASARVSLDGWDGRQIEFYNQGTVPVYIQLGGAAVAATVPAASATTPTAGSYSIAPGSIIMISRNPPEGGTYTHLAHISGSAAQPLHATPGIGV